MEKNQYYPEADLVIRHARLYTMAIDVSDFQAGDRDFPVVDDGGVAVKDGRIIAVGSSADMEPLVGTHTQVIEAAGKVVTPGFVESHEHVTFLGEKLANVDLTGITRRD